MKIKTPEDLSGSRVKRIFFSDTDGGSISASDKNALIFQYCFHGDHAETWVVQYDGETETARHNCKYLSTIEWWEG